MNQPRFKYRHKSVRTNPDSLEPLAKSEQRTQICLAADLVFMVVLGRIWSEKGKWWWSGRAMAAEARWWMVQGGGAQKY